MMTTSPSPNDNRCSVVGPDRRGLTTTSFMDVEFRTCASMPSTSFKACNSASDSSWEGHTNVADRPRSNILRASVTVLLITIESTSCSTTKSVPRPAMPVEIVTASSSPPRATISDSDSAFSALRRP